MEAGLERCGHVDNLTTERLKRIAVAGVARRRDDDPITDIERGEERSNERTRRADGEHQPIGIHLDAVPLVVVASNTGTELRRARSGRIPENVLVECTVSGLDDPGRSRCGRLTDLEMQHLTAGEFAFLRSSHDFHHEERGDLTAARRGALGLHDGSLARSGTESVVLGVKAKPRHWYVDRP